MKIKIPKTLDLQSTLNFCNFMDTIHNDDSYIYDYEEINRAEPFGLLLMSSKIRRFVDDTPPECEHKDKNFKNQKNVTGYIAHMGFFKSVYQDYGKNPGEAQGSSTYIPLTELNFNDIRKDNKDIYTYIDKTSEDIANILARNDSNLKKYLKYSTSELIRNVLEHSESESFWYAGQFWPSKGIVEVAVLDEGIGMKESFKRNKKLTINSDEDAIKLAMQPGISKSGIGKTIKDQYDNGGFGLYMISNFCETGGDIAICTGNNCLLINDKETIKYETSFKGTAIRIRLNSEKMGKISDIMKELSIKGTKEAKEYKKMDKIDISRIL
ncbi:ATP-binding protein [Clostridium botulinum]|uniref:ATP-binding protein n=2 Tax=Clostridium botulinum TaxID=1491 RepID=UPI0007734201|nr:ATP-binding protein [Clostridium botulinum]MBY7025230.1 ATP-binding protein [Clostridium botulinum]NFE85457.1 ATP-binding protein [Clostridium botulinum]NFG36823.1 ATP-binding protein [Clostridium botulinum]NFN27379.1 ATP-binding protein [Clostridium botulinum]NFN46612.1 ATP-binding protein [Clostridium botulinum]